MYVISEKPGHETKNYNRSTTVRLKSDIDSLKLSPLFFKLFYIISSYSWSINITIPHLIQLLNCSEMINTISTGTMLCYVSTDVIQLIVLMIHHTYFYYTSRSGTAVQSVWPDFSTYCRPATDNREVAKIAYEKRETWKNFI